MPTKLGDWKKELDLIAKVMHEVSHETDPQVIGQKYGAAVRTLFPHDRWFAVSARGLEQPRYRVTRSSTWTQTINPWEEKHRLPLLSGGLLSELIYSNQPRLIEGLRFSEDDPAAEYMRGMSTLLFCPQFENGKTVNATVLLWDDPAKLDKDWIPILVWQTALYGRATHNLILRKELAKAYAQLDDELRVVAELQRTLLPIRLPTLPGVDLAAYYQTARHAGGDFYDFFPQTHGRWGISIADVSGHGASSAVLGAIAHAIAHTHPDPPAPPSSVLNFVNAHLTTLYTRLSGTFITVFYGVIDPNTRSLTYACAGHPPPRVKRDGAITGLDQIGGVPLGLIAEERYEDHCVELHPGDTLLFYTDGITEAFSPQGELFDVERLDAILAQTHDSAQALVDAVVAAVERHTGGAVPLDDRTIVAARFA